MRHKKHIAAQFEFTATAKVFNLAGELAKFDGSKIVLPPAKPEAQREDNTDPLFVGLETVKRGRELYAQDQNLGL